MLFTKEEKIGRDKFKKEFSNHYHIQELEITADTDFLLTGRTTGQKYNVEIKNRYVPLTTYSGCSMLEVAKLNDFTRSYQNDPERKIIYFNFYNGSNWIAFDMTGRIRNNIDICNQYIKILPKATAEDRGEREKLVIDLCFQQNQYVMDKMRYVPPPTSQERLKQLKKYRTI